MPLVRVPGGDRGARRRDRAGRARGRELTGALEDLLRPALQLGVQVARDGEAADPPVPAPTALRKVLTFKKLPPRALASARRVIERDEDFRARVLEAADEAAVGRASWLFLARPGGWEAELADLAADEERSRTSESEARGEREAQRRARRADEALRRAEERLSAAERGADEARSALADERRLRHLAETEAGRLRRAVEDLRAQLAAAGEAAADALSRAREAEDDARTWRARAEGAAAGAMPESTAGAAVDLDGIAAGVDAAAGALSEAAEALDALSGAVQGARARAGAGPARRSRARTGPELRRRRRDPAPLPPGIRDDGPEAAEALVRVGGLVLLVDGYNVSLRGWPDRSLPEQRERLVDALHGLAARSGADVHVVFDGADDAARTVAARPRSRVTITFTPEGVEADDLLAALVDALPPARPAAVVSDDREVRGAAAERGANVLTVGQLLGLLRA